MPMILAIHGTKTSILITELDTPKAATGEHDNDQ